MSMSSNKPDRKYTYGDILQSPEEERWELIDGVLYDMSPAPSGALGGPVAKPKRWLPRSRVEMI